MVSGHFGAERFLITPTNTKYEVWSSWNKYELSIAKNHNSLCQTRAA